MYYLRTDLKTGGVTPQKVYITNAKVLWIAVLWA